MAIDLSLLPQPEIIETLSFETVLARKKSRLLELTPDDDKSAMTAVLALESEPIVILLEESAYQEINLRARINDAIHAVLLAYATGGNLDHRAALIGVTRLSGESDTRLRGRTLLAPEGLTTAGPERSYFFHAISASVAVRDCSVISPTPGVVLVTVLAEPDDDNPDGLPDAALLSKVSAALSADDVRPLTDKVDVVSVSIIHYQVTARLTMLSGPDAGLVQSAAFDACRQYVDRQFMIGCDITLSGLYAALHQPGVMNVNLISPAQSIVVNQSSSARCLAINLSLGGVGQ